jgi:hypothetical protein
MVIGEVADNLSATVFEWGILLSVQSGKRSEHEIEERKESPSKNIQNARTNKACDEREVSWDKQMLASTKN